MGTLRKLFGKNKVGETAKVETVKKSVDAETAKTVKNKKYHGQKPRSTYRFGGGRSSRADGQPIFSPKRTKLKGYQKTA